MELFRFGKVGYAADNSGRLVLQISKNGASGKNVEIGPVLLLKLVVLGPTSISAPKCSGTSAAKSGSSGPCRRPRAVQRSENRASYRIYRTISRKPMVAEDGRPAHCRSFSGVDVLLTHG